ncbi:TIR domain-containing protein [Streptomyces tagetis]|uniref:Nucleotide-binding protein n=1 Tax=Streptomyces tagetis TaxID=2820809 RepID=A0A940XSG5_9ACTN|nr:nucleotide-binding protein [Streptomyces sp. RG38]MBQ0828863.1 nucleotide-binding protein [Streptomyces sp. RG38]
MSGHHFHDNDFGQSSFGAHSTNNFGGNQSVGNQGTQIFGNGSAAPPPPASPPTRPAVADPVLDGTDPDRARGVFVVHGRDEQARSAVFELLRRIDLRPKEWEDLVRATGHTSPFLGDVVSAAPAQARAALVLLTPDDIVTLHPALRGWNEPEYETRPVCQPRPNVLIELGMVLMAYPQRTLIVECGDLRPVSDIAGRNVIRFDGSATAVGKIVERLKLAGCAVNDTGSDWRRTDALQGLSAYHRRP